MAELDVELEVAIIATVLSFVVGYLLSLLIERKKKADSVSDAAKSLILELQKIQSELSAHVRTDEQVKAVSADFAKGHINTTIFSMQTAAGDSALYSGVFRDFDKDTQLKVAAVYNDIKFANTIELKFMEATISVTGPVSTAFIESLRMFYLMMNNIERDLQTSISGLITFLKDKYRIDEATPGTNENLLGQNTIRE